MGLGAEMRARRLHMRLSQDEVATAADVTHEWLSRVERDRIKMPGWKPLERVAKALGVQPEPWLALAGYQVTPSTDTPESAADYIRMAQRILADALEKVEKASRQAREPEIDASVRGVTAILLRASAN